jgi:hypothetical protein
VSLATAVRGRPGWVNPHTLTQHAVTRARGLAAVHALHTTDQAKHVANIAAAVTAIAGVGTSKSSLVGLPLTSRLAIGLLAFRKGMVKSAVQPNSDFPRTGPLEERCPRREIETAPEISYSLDRSDALHQLPRRFLSITYAGPQMNRSRCVGTLGECLCADPWRPL